MINLQKDIFSSKWIVILPVLITIVLFSSFVTFDWLNWDDPDYVLKNPLVGELTSERIIDNFTSFTIGAYHPITTLSYCIDYSLGEFNPKIYHISNILIHSINVVLLFFFIRHLVKENRTAVIVTILFAIHPMNIEPVAWISGRKDLLMLFFCLLGMLSYLKLEQQKKYWATFIFFLLALLSKGTAMVFPILLLLIDYLQNKKLSWKIIQPKIPMFVVAILFSVLAKVGQQQASAMTDFSDINFLQSLTIGVSNYVQYLAKFFIPYSQSGFHPNPTDTELESLAGYLIPFICIVLLWFRYGRKNNQINFAIGFFSVSIFLLLQVIPFGQAIAADRFTYFPYVGLFAGIAFGLQYVFEKFKNKRVIIYTLSISLISFFIAKNPQQLKTWKNSEVFWGNVLEYYPESATAHNLLGFHYLETGDYEKSIESFKNKMKFGDESYTAYNNIGLNYLQMNDKPKALKHFNMALDLEPKLLAARENRALTCLDLNQDEVALDDLTYLRKNQPLNPNLLYGEGLLLIKNRNYPQAELKLDSAKTLGCSLNLLPYYQGLAKLNCRKVQEAIPYFRTSIDNRKNEGASFNCLSKCNYNLGNFKLAKDQAKVAIQLGFPVDSSYIEILNSL